MSQNKISVSSNNSYAQALFELASESNALSEIEKQVNSILILIKNSEDFSYLIKNPTTKSEDLIKVMEMSFFVKACVVGLKLFPAINAEIEGQDF